MEDLNKFDWLFVTGLMAFFWWWIKNISLSIKELTASINELRLSIKGDYVHKDDCSKHKTECELRFNDYRDEFRADIKGVHKRIDKHVEEAR